jgi:ABC-type multidrug transport system ATPase subunit
MLKITQLNKAYTNGVKALDNVSLDIPKGMFGLLGPNGAGKSTLMKTIVGLQHPDSGDIVFQGVDIVSDTYVGVYSDMNGFGTYISPFNWKMLFGCSFTFLTALCFVNGQQLKNAFSI